MTENLKDLEQMIKFARKHKLKAITIGDVTLTLGDAPPKRVRTKKGQSLESIPTDELSEDDVLNWSSGGE